MSRCPRGRQELVDRFLLELCQAPNLGPGASSSSATSWFASGVQSQSCAHCFQHILAHGPSPARSGTTSTPPPPAPGVRALRVCECGSPAATRSPAICDCGGLLPGPAHHELDQRLSAHFKHLAAAAAQQQQTSTVGAAFDDSAAGTTTTAAGVNNTSAHPRDAPAIAAVSSGIVHAIPAPGGGYGAGIAAPHHSTQFAPSGLPYGIVTPLPFAPRGGGYPLFPTTGYPHHDPSGGGVRAMSTSVGGPYGGPMYQQTPAGVVQLPSRRPSHPHHHQLYHHHTAGASGGGGGFGLECPPQPVVQFVSPNGGSASTPVAGSNAFAALSITPVPPGGGPNSPKVPWATGLFESMSSPNAVIESIFCGHCQLAHQRGRLLTGRPQLHVPTLFCTLLVDAVLTMGLARVFCTWIVRQHIRDRYHIANECLYDLCAVVFCNPCALCQQHAEFAARQEYCGGVCMTGASVATRAPQGIATIGDGDPAAV